MPVTTNRFLQSYAGGATDDRGRLLALILRQDDDWLEVTHDFIQWLFPLQEASGTNPGAPRVDAATRDAFRADPLLQQHLRASLLRMLAFLGLQFDASGPSCRRQGGPAASGSGSPTTPTTACA
jgi:hypothetical protein